MPNGFARSTAGEYTSNMFWIVGIALIASWVVAVVFTPYLGVKLLPDIKTVEGGHDAIYDTPRYNRFRRVLDARHRAQVARRRFGRRRSSSSPFSAWASVKKQFFPISDRPEVLVEVQMPYGTSIEQTSAAAAEGRGMAARSSRKRRSSPLMSVRVRRASTWRCRRSCPIRRSPRSWSARKPGGARCIERAAAQSRRRRPRAGSARARHAARVRPVFAVPGRLSASSGPDPDKLREIAGEVQRVMHAQSDDAHGQHRLGHALANAALRPCSRTACRRWA